MQPIPTNLPCDHQNAEKIDQNIIHPPNTFLGRQFTKWSHLWDAISQPKHQYGNWYILTKVRAQSQKIVHTLKCQLCWNILEITKIGRKLKVSKCQNKHNHKELPTNDETDQLLSLQNHVEQLYLIHKQYNIFTSLKVSHLQLSDNSLKYKTYQIYTNSHTNKPKGVSFISYKIYLENELIATNHIKFGLKTNKELDIISILLPLTDSYINKIRNVKIYCKQQYANILKNNKIQNNIIISSKIKIIQKIVNQMKTVQFIPMNQNQRQLKTNDIIQSLQINNFQAKLWNQSLKCLKQQIHSRSVSNSYIDI